LSDTIITYETIYERLRKEKYEPELQKLSETFFQDVIEYLKEKQSIVETQKSQDSIFSKEAEKTEKQVQNIKKILKELYERRENKLIQLALFSSRTNTPLEVSNLLPEEIDFFNAINKLFSRYREGILDNLISLKEPKVAKPKHIKVENQEKTRLVRFLNPVPKFMGEDLNIYGPFDAEDVSNLPNEVASLLIKRKRAEEIK